MEESVLLCPNKAIAFDDPHLKYPYIASRKYDGNRLLIKQGKLFTRSLKPQPNLFLPTYLKEICEYSLKEKLIFDCELYDKDLNFPDLQSIVRSFDKKPSKNLKAYVFDCVAESEWGQDWRKGTPFIERMSYLNEFIAPKNFPHIHTVEHTLVFSPDYAKTMYESYIADGFEGIILRSGRAGYKNNRATLKEDIIYKFKEFVTIDGVIIEVTQGKKMREGIERTRDVMGGLERSHKQEDYELAETMGCFVVHTTWNGSEIKVGVNLAEGMDAEARKGFWLNRDSLIGKHVEFKAMKIGSKDVPRIGRLVRFRPDLD